MARSLSKVAKEAKEVPFYYKDLVKRKVPTLNLIDSNNWGCRAYFAAMGRQILSKKSKQPIQGVVIWVSMIKSFLANVSEHSKFEPYVGFCFDPKSDTTWRYRAQEQWAQANKKDAKVIFSKKGKSFSPMYKGTRDRGKYPDIGFQIDLMRHITELNGFTVLRKAPYECDDLIGTLATRFGLSGECFVDMYTVDKDYFQLIVSKYIRLVMQEQQNREAQAYTIKNAKDYFGIRPDQLIDFLAMSGDGADNVPGIPGIADGTAAKLLNQYDSFENLLANIDGIKSKAVWAKALRGEVPLMDMDFQRELVTITKNVPTLPKDLSAFKRGEPDRKALAKLKKELGIDVTF